MAPPEVQEPPQGTPRIVAYGDSIAVGIGSQPGVTRIATGGTGLSNNNLPSRTDIRSGDSVIVSVGWNDTGFAAGNQRDYTQRVRAMIQDIKRENGGAPIVLFGLEQGTGNDGGVYSGGNLISGERIRATNAALQAAAEAEGIAFLTPNTAGIAGARSATNQDSLHYNPAGYALIRSQASNRLSYAPTTTTPPIDASTTGINALQQRTDVAPAPSGTGTIGGISDTQDRDAARAEELRRQFAGTSEESLREFFGNLFNNEQLQGNPFATLVLGVIGALLGYDIGANRRAPERDSTTVADADTNVSPDGQPVTRRERGDGTPDTEGADITGDTNPTFGAGRIFRATDLVPDMARAARNSGMSESAIRRAAARSAAALNTMHPQMRAAVAEQVREMFLDGHPVVITECFRSIEEQNRLYAQGRTTGGDIVTHARGGDSFHNYGLACDIVPANTNGSPVWGRGANGTTFDTIRGYMRNAGVRTIGDWDKPHYEMPISLRTLRGLQRDADGYPILPNIPAQWAAANARTGAGSTAVAGASPSPAAPVAEELTIAQAAWNIIPASVRSLLSGSDGNYSGSGAHKLSQSELNSASGSLIQQGVRDANRDGIIQLAELSSYIRGLQAPARPSTSGPLLAVV